MKSGPLGSAHDRAEFLQQRREMMQAWADYCDSLRDAIKPSVKEKGAGVRPAVKTMGRPPLAHTSAKA